MYSKGAEYGAFEDLVKTGYIIKIKEIDVEIHFFQKEEKHFLKYYKAINMIEQIDFVNIGINRYSEADGFYFTSAHLVNKRYFNKTSTRDGTPGGRDLMELNF